LYASFSGVVVLCDIVLDYTKLVLYVRETRDQYAGLEFYECDLTQPPHIFKHYVTLEQDSLPPLFHVHRPIGNRFLAVILADYGDEDCKEVVDLEQHALMPLNLAPGVADYNRILATDHSLLFFYTCYSSDNLKYTEWDVTTKQTKSFQVHVNDVRNCFVEALCANEQFIVFQKCEYPKFDWRYLLILKRDVDGIQNENGGSLTEHIICSNENCSAFSNRRLSGCFEPGNTSHLFLVSRLHNEKNEPIYLIDVINIETCTTVIHHCCDKNIRFFADEECSFYPPQSFRLN